MTIENLNAEYAPNNGEPFRRCFVANFQSDNEYSDLTRFGEQHNVTMNFFKFESVENAMNYIRKHLAAATSDDYLVMSGNPFLCALAMKVWFEFFDQCNVLTWNSKDRKYIEHVVRDVDGKK